MSHSARAAQLTESWLSGPIHLTLKLLFVIALALLIRAGLFKVINRVTERATEAVLPQFRSPLPSGRLLTRGMLTSVLIPRRVLPGGRRGRGDGGPGRVQAAQGVPSGNGSASAAHETTSGEEAPHRNMAENQAPDAAHPGQVAPSVASVEGAIVAERRQQRVRALGAILRSATSVAIFAITGAVVLGDLGINLAPLLASAGVVGIAIGFGAQNLVRDYLTGIFMLLEDQYGVGDVITVGDATGTVETMTLRITRIRDVNGVVWHIRNGTIDQVGNKSQGWARAVIDFPVPYTADLAAIRTILDEVAESAWSEPALRGVMLEEPEVWGAQDISSAGVTMRLVARTAPLRQWEVEREMRARVKAALDAAGIQPMPDPLAQDPFPAPAAPPRRRHQPSDS
jgi:small-conductance mechanosensitive channel